MIPNELNSVKQFNALQQGTLDQQDAGLPHVLIISNHFEVKTYLPYAGIFVDRQIASLKKAGVKVSTFDIGSRHSPVHIFRKWIELRRYVRQLTPDLVHGQFGTIVGVLTAFAGRPSVVSFCGGDLQRGASVSLVRQLFGFLLSNIAALHATGLICKSEQLRQALWWRKNQAVVIPSGIDLNLFVPGPQIEARKELGWSLENPIAIINVREDPRAKGLDLAMAAMKFVSTRLPHAELQVIENVEPMRMPLYYQAADVLLCMSIAEGSPNVVKEALACNLPVVSTPVGDVQERLAGVVPSCVVSRDPSSLGRAIVDILLTKQRSNGREMVASLGLNQVAEQVLAVYRTVLRSNHSLG